MKIKFVQNFRGRETNERYFAIGEEADLDTGENLVERGVAVEVTPKPEPKPVEKASPKPRRKAPAKKEEGK